jgi:ribosomal protein L40E
MDCPKCHHLNPEDAIFCNGCGHKLEIECPKCGKANPPGSKFCHKCGNDISIPFAIKEVRNVSQPAQYAPTRRVPVFLTEGERHQATIVFSDLSGYTSMNEKLDPEEVEAIMSRIKMEAVRIVERHEGIVNQFVGDEVLAAQTKYYLAQMLVQKDEIERSRYILNEIRDMFENCGILSWQKKCEQALDTIYTRRI